VSKNKVSQTDKQYSINFLFMGVALITLGIYTNFYDPFNTPKLIILILVASMTFSYLISDYRINGFFVSNLDKLFFLILIFFTTGLIVATISSNDTYISVLGDTQRKNGFLQYFSLVIILIYSSRAINVLQAKSLIKYAVNVSFILSFYGLLQVSGKDFIKWNNPYNSMIGTLGNPNFASALLAVLLVILVTQFTNTRLSLSYRLIAIVAAIMSIICIIFSDSRQGLVAFGAGFLFYFSLTIYFKNKKVGLSLILISAMLLILSIFGMLQKGPLAYYLYKDSVSVRGFYWRSAVEMFQNNIFTGVGLDRYGEYFKLYRESEYPLRYGFNINSNNAHNVFLQFFATGGVLLGLSYLILCLVVFSLGIKLIRNSEKEVRSITITLLSAWIAFQSQSFISIDSIGLSIWGWIISGAILGMVRNHGKLVLTSNHAVNYKASSNKRMKEEIYQKFIFVLILVPTLTFSYFQSKSESDILKAKFFTVPSAEQNKPEVAKYSKEVIDNRFTDPAYKLLSLTYLYDMGFKNEAYNNIKKLEVSDPNNLDVLLSLAVISQELGNVSDSIETREKITKLDPWNAENYFQLIKLYKLVGNLESAKINYEKIISFAPNIELAIQAAKIIN
jgi:O-antigen ligase